MGNKVFVSYKYRDFSVKPLEGYSSEASFTRGYVDYLQDKLELSDHIYKGERGDNDLSQYSDKYIEEYLKPKIADSSVTAILISPGMRDLSKSERDQWIPWEVSYSLKEITREDKTSHTNAIIGIVLPDSGGLYNYVISRNVCCQTGCLNYDTSRLFPILRDNTFNRFNPDAKMCRNHSTIQYGEYSYMPIVTWDEFIANPAAQISRVCKLRDDHIDEYRVKKILEA